MKHLKIGYWPLSPNLSSPGDRRRLIFWANARGHTVVTSRDQSVDVIVASENSDFNSLYFSQMKVPIIFDLIDAYLSPLNPYDDFLRGLAKRIAGQISGSIKPFSQHVIDFCSNSSAVICSSVEQEEIIRLYNNNTHVILDSHEEIPFLNPGNSRVLKSEKCRILWEGLPATIGGVKSISSILSEVSKTTALSLDFVTNEKYFQFLNKYIERNTFDLLKKNLDQLTYLANIIPWTPSALVKSAKDSDIAVIPIDLSVPMQRLKPENRLLIMWRLGLPCLTSPSPAYSRVSRDAGVSTTCGTLEEWFEKLNRLLSDSDFAFSEIQAGQIYLRKNHERSHLLNRWDKAFESVMG